MAKVPAKLMLEPFVEPDVLETAGKNASDDAVSAAISASILGGSKKSKPADETFFGTAGAKELVTAAAASPTPSRSRTRCSNPRGWSHRYKTSSHRARIHDDSTMVNARR